MIYVWMLLALVAIAVVAILLRRDAKQFKIEQVDTDNPYEAAVVAEVWRTGKTVVGTVDPQTGEFKMEQID